MWVKNRDRIVNAGFSVATACLLVLVMPMIFTVGCISFVAVNVLRVTDIIHKAVRKRDETQDKNFSFN